MSTIGQDPYVETMGERFTAVNFMITNELVILDYLRVELDIAFLERGYAQKRGDETQHSLYYFEAPLMVTLSPFRFLYLGAGVGFACKIATADYESNRYAELLQGYDNFVDAKTERFECNFVLAIGVRFSITERITAVGEIRHVYGLTDANAHSVNNLFYEDDRNVFERYRTFYLFIGAGYRFL